MEDRKLNEKESLELITQMIQNTRRNLDAGGGNMFLLWGYVGVVVTLGVLAAWSLTENTVALWGFWALPVVGWFWALPVVGWSLSWWFGRKWRKKQRAKDYTDRVVRQVWQIIGIASCGVAGFATLYHSYEMILPLCGLLVSLGSLLTGIIIRYTLFSGLPSCGFAWSLEQVFEVATDGASMDTLIIFVLILLFSLVIPGHVLNRRVRKDVSIGK